MCNPTIFFNSQSFGAVEIYNEKPTDTTIKPLLIAANAKPVECSI